MIGGWDDMPPGIEVSSAAAGGGGGGGGFIPPPPGAHMEGGFNPFPGAARSSSAWPPPSSAPAFPSFRTPWGSQSPGFQAHSPLSSAGWGMDHSNYSPMSFQDHTPGMSWGSWGPSPASRGLSTPASWNEPTLGQPVSASPWFNGTPLPEERRWPKSPRFDEMHLERSLSQASASPGFFGGHPLHRSLSTGATRPRRSRSRSRSQTTQNFLPHLALQAEEIGPNYPARRPRDWRADYDPRPNSFIPRIRKPETNVTEFKDPTRRTVHETLAYSAQDPVVTWDVRCYPSNDVLEFRRLGRDYNHIDFAQLATSPPIHTMRLLHPLLPWYIDIKQQNPNGVTVEDVILHIYLALNTPIVTTHFYNEDVSENHRNRINKAFYERTKVDPALVDQGVKKVDFLEDKVDFMGLSRTKDGLWELKTRRLED